MPRSYGTTNVMPYTTPPPVGLAGDEYYNPSTKQLFLSDGTSWNAIVGGGGGSGSPAYTQTITGPTVAGSPYAIIHSLNTSFPLVEIWDAVTHQLVSAQVAVFNANQVNVSFAAAPPNNVVVVVSTGGGGPPGPSTTPVFTQTIPTPTVANSPYTINHNLGTTTPLVQLWDAVNGSLVLAKVAVLNPSSLSVAFSQNPPNGVTVVVSSGGMGPAGPAGPGTQPTAAYTTTLTAPSAAGSPYTLTHNLATTAPLVHLWDAVTGLAIFAQLQVVSANQISVAFSSNPPNNVVVVVSTGSMGQPGPQGPPGPSTLYNVVYYQTVPAPTVASSPYSIAHNLNSTYVLVQTWDSVTGQMVQMQVNIVDANHVSLRTAQNMPNAVNVVVTAGPVSPAPVNPADLATKLYVDAKSATLPAPISSGSGIQSFTDALGDIWVAANGVSGGAWRRARDVLHARYTMTANVTGSSAMIPMAVATTDIMGCAGSGGFVAPIAGSYLVSTQFNLASSPAAAGNQQAGIFVNGLQVSYGQTTYYIAANPAWPATNCTDMLSVNAGDLIQAYFWTTQSVTAQAGGGRSYMTVAYQGPST